MAERSPPSYSSQYPKILRCKSTKTFFWCLCLCNTSRTWTGIILDSSCSNATSMYKFMPARPLALRRVCQPSRSLFVRTVWKYTLQHAGGQTLLSIQVRPTYCRSAVSAAVASCSSRRKIGVMCCASRKYNAITFPRNLKVPSSLAYATCSPHSLMRLQMVWVKWKAHPFNSTAGKTTRAARHVDSSKSRTIRLIRRCGSMAHSSLNTAA